MAETFLKLEENLILILRLKNMINNQTRQNVHIFKNNDFVYISAKL